MFDWLVANREWIFGGIGVAVIGWIGWFLFGRGKTQSQKAGDNSTNIQVGRDLKGDISRDRRE